MKIVIIGDGKVGHKLTIQLSEENYDVVLIDQNEGKLKEALNQLDILCITGDGADAKVQKEAGVPGADLVVACASSYRISRGIFTGIIDSSGPTSSGTRILRTSCSFKIVRPKAGSPLRRMACSARFIVVNICLEKPFFLRNARIVRPESWALTV